MPVRNLRNQRFGKLVVLAFDSIQRSQAQWRCLCDCGQEKVIRSGHLVSGNTTSCGCQKGNRKHGHSKRGQVSGTYYSWQSMWLRCTLPPENKNFKYYGGRGITICDRWKTFDLFLEDMGERPKGTTLDRRNNDGHYEPGNCRWATAKEQHDNRRPFTQVRRIVNGRSVF